MWSEAPETNKKKERRSGRYFVSFEQKPLFSSTNKPGEGAVHEKRLRDVSEPRRDEITTRLLVVLHQGLHYWAYFCTTDMRSPLFRELDISGDHFVMVCGVTPCTIGVGVLAQICPFRQTSLDAPEHLAHQPSRPLDRVRLRLPGRGGGRRLSA